MFKIIAKFVAGAALLAIPLSGCSEIADAPTLPSVDTSGISLPSVGGNPKGLGQDPMERGGNYYTEMGKAKFTGSCDKQKPGTYEYSALKDNGQVGPVCAVITTGKGGQEPAYDSAGIKGNNFKASIPSVSGGKAYNGYFYNRSHLVGRALGGNGEAENLITGTRMQNVGEKNKGGMRYPETKAEAYVKSGKAKSCPLIYQVTPHYANSKDKVPTWVEVDMRNCDSSINQRVATFNDAAGYKIDYATGVVIKK